MVNPKHRSMTSSWYTPADIIESARRVLGTIDLDPASCELANATVKATKYYTEEDNGLNQEWHGNVFCNPPGGKLYGRSLAKLFWQKLMDSPGVTQAIFLAFSIELLQTSQLSAFQSACDFTLCIPRRRLCFTDAKGNMVKGNTHASAIVYINNELDMERNYQGVNNFAKEFSSYGSILTAFKA